MKTDLDVLFNLVQPALLQSAGTETVETHRFLRFSLADGLSAVLPLDRLSEVIKFNLLGILPIPAMPVYLLGISNWRGEAIWVLDLAGLLGGEGLTHREALPHSCMAIVMPAGEQHLGILVDQVKTIDEYDPQSLQPISAEMGDAEFVSMCKGYFAHEAADPLWLIDVDALLQKVLI